MVVRLKRPLSGFEFMCKSELIEVYYISVTEFDVVLKLQEAYLSTVFYIELCI
jgi:hypothetical protein